MLVIIIIYYKGPQDETQSLWMPLKDKKKEDKTKQTKQIKQKKQKNKRKTLVWCYIYTNPSTISAPYIVSCSSKPLDVIPTSSTAFSRFTFGGPFPS